MTTNLKVILFVLVAIKSNLECIVPGDLCKLHNSKIKCFNNDNSLSEFQVSCQSEFNHCQSPFMYSCGNDKCARTMHSCGEYNLAERYMNSSLFSSQVQMTQLGNELESRMRNYIKMHKLLKTKIRNCAPKAYVWQERDVCRRRPKCLLPLKISMKNHSKSFFQTTVCPCNGIRRFECEINYCALSQEACNSFRRLGSHLTSSIRKCPFIEKSYAFKQQI